MVNGCTWLKDNPSLDVSALFDKLIYNNIFLETKRCGFYNDELLHGGPSGSNGEVNQAGVIPNEQTPMTNGEANLDVIPADLEILNPRPNRRRRDADNLDFNFVDTGKIHYLKKSVY